MGKTTLLQEAHLLGPRLGVSRGGAELAAQHLGGTLAFACGQVGLEVGNGFTFDAMTVKFREDALVTVARRTAMYQRLGKAFFGKKTGLFEPLQQRLDVVTLLRVRGKLTRKFQATMLT